MNNIIAFDLGIYPINCIYIAANEYQNISKIDIEFEDNKCLCTFKQCSTSVEIVIREFCNYVIDLMNTVGK